MAKYLGTLAALLGMAGKNGPQVQVVEADDSEGDDDSGEVQIVEADDSEGDDSEGDDDSGEIQIVEADDSEGDDDSGAIVVRPKRKKARNQVVVVRPKKKAKKVTKIKLPSQRRAGDQFDRAGQRVSQQSTALSTATPIAAFKLEGPLIAGTYERNIGCPDFFVQTSLFANAKAGTNVSTFRYTIGGMPGNGNTINDYPEKYGALVQNRTIEMRELAPGMPLAVEFVLATALEAGESAIIVLEGTRGSQTALRSPNV